MDKKALTGWSEIADFFGWSEKKTKLKKDEFAVAGAIFYSYVGRPPRRMVQAFPRVLEEWSRKKSLKKENS